MATLLQSFSNLVRLYNLILCPQKGVPLSSVLFLLTFYVAFSIPVKKENCGEGHKSEFHKQ